MPERETWGCPICSKPIKYGTVCDTWETTCVNRSKANVTGQCFILNYSKSTGNAIGIAAISDEGLTSDKRLSKHDEMP